MKDPLWMDGDPFALGTESDEELLAPEWDQMYDDIYNDVLPDDPNRAR